jgi:hypothetical protein
VADITNTEQLRSAGDGDVAVVGRAEDTRESAVVLLDDEGICRIGDLDAWPNELRGKRVRARGVLELEEEPGGASDPRVQRHSGRDYVLQQATWEAAE